MTSGEAQHDEEHERESAEPSKRIGLPASSNYDKSTPGELCGSCRPKH